MPRFKYVLIVIDRFLDRTVTEIGGDNLMSLRLRAGETEDPANDVVAVIHELDDEERPTGPNLR